MQAAGAVCRFPSVAAMQLVPHQPQATLLMHSPHVASWLHVVHPGVPGLHGGGGQPVTTITVKSPNKSADAYVWMVGRIDPLPSRGACPSAPAASPRRYPPRGAV